MRSPLYMQVYSLLYGFLKFFNIDHPVLIAYAPRLIGAFQAAVFDFYLVKLTAVHLGPVYAKPMVSYVTPVEVELILPPASR